MRHEKIIHREDGSIVKIITLISANLFVQSGYEQEQFALVKLGNSEEWRSYYRQYSPKFLSRQDYMDNYKPKTFLGVVTIGEALKAGIEAKNKFFG
jgi:hypothetical protein